MESCETDGLLVSRVRRGDSRAFDRLVRRHLRAAHAVARAKLDNPDDADDVVQDAFIKALERIDDCRNPDGSEDGCSSSSATPPTTTGSVNE